MLDRLERVIYVGKARNLRNRVASYFRSPAGMTPKTRALVANTAGMDVTVTHTETEALLLENTLIKEYQPRYNVLLRDDKSFPFIHVSTHQAFPRLRFHRGAKTGEGRYFGPFASAGATRETLNLLQKLFQVRQCEESFFRNRARPCLQHQIGRCTAPCVDRIDEPTYRDDVQHAIMFLEGKSEEMIGRLVERMENAAGEFAYEQAGRYRDQIASLRRVQERQYVSGANGDIDVVGAVHEAGVGLIELILIRNGQSLGSRTLQPRHAVESDPVELLRAFIMQRYLSQTSKGSVPNEIITSEPLDDADSLATALSRDRGTSDLNSPPGARSPGPVAADGA